jgi:hypothetical protein
MKTLLIFSLTAAICFACSKEEVPKANYDSNTTQKTPSLRSSAPNELIEEEYPPNSGNMRYTCISNPVDCGPWITVRSRRILFANLVSAIENGTLDEFFSGTEWELLFDNLDEDLVAGLQSGNLTISEVENTADDERIFIIHDSNTEPSRATSLLALPFDTNEE